MTSASCAPRSITSPAAASPRRWGRSAACSIVAIRVLAWPLDRPDHRRADRVARWRSSWSSPSSSGAGGRRTRRGERTAVRWLGLGLAWTAVALTVAAPRPGDGRRRPAERPLSRVRGPDGVRAASASGAGAAASLRADRAVAASPGLRQVPALVAGGRRRGPDRLERRPSARPPSRPDGGFPAAAAPPRGSRPR